MKFGNALLSTELSGALGGVVGATARGGVGYFRKRTRPSNPSSAAQTVARSIMNALSAAWKSTLTGAQRAGWTALAVDKESGIDAFVKGNFQQLITVSGAYTAAAPASISIVTAPMVTDGEYAISGQEIGLTNPGTSQVKWAAYVTKPQSASRASRQFNYQYATAVAGVDGTVNLADNPLLADAVAGQVIYLRMVPFGSASPKLGQVGTAQEFRITCV